MMKTLAIIASAIMMLGTTQAFAAGAPKDKKEAKKTVKAAKLTKAEKKDKKADIASVDDFSYAIGVAQTNGLKEYLVQQLGVDTANMGDFLRGVKDVASAKKGDKSLVQYAAGIQIATQVLSDFPPRINQQITGAKSDTTFINEDLYKKGFLAALEGKPTLTPDSAAKLVTKQMEYYHNELTTKQYAQNKKDGEDFLKANAKLADVKTLPSGVQYKVITEGKGKKPTADQAVEVNYEGRLIDGTVFDSNKGKKPVKFGCSQVIKGWTEALTNMTEGSKWEIYIPQELAYGAREAGDKIKPYSALIFEVELVKIVEPKSDK